MIGVFDSGYGGLTVLRSLLRLLPEYDYLYLGDNARAPYGTRSFGIVTDFTRQAVDHLFSHACPLVILACNTASAKALRTLQQSWLPGTADPTRRILGVIRPTAEAVGRITRGGHIGVMATPGTIASGSYDIEIAKLWPQTTVTGQACPMWVPIVENGEADGPGADYFVAKYIDELFARDAQIDTVILACTHYPLLFDKIRDYLDSRGLGHVQLVTQGDIVAYSLRDYLDRHPEMESRLTRGGTVTYLTTEAPDRFADLAALFMAAPVTAQHTTL